jgi:cyclic-di-GMP-binding protein
MQTFALPATAHAHPPEFTDARSAREWLEQLDGTHPLQSLSRLLGQINLLNRYELPAGERLRIMEELRDTVLQTQATTANRFVGRPLPLSASERAAFDANQGLWDTLATGYLHCLAAALDGDGGVSGQVALIAHRALGALAHMQLDALRTSHLAAAGYWRRTHACYEAAENLGVAERKIKDSVLADERPTSVRAAYVLCVLLHTASPFGLSHRQLRVLHRWLGKWAGKVTLLDKAVHHCALPPLMLDLSSDEAIARNSQIGSRLRWLVLDDFSHSVRKRLALLAQGETPTSLRLGEELSPTQADRLLRHLHTHCCRGGLTRNETRRPMQQNASLVIGMDAVQRFLGSSNGEPDDALADTGLETRATGYLVEDWRIIDDSPTGLRLGRRATFEGARIGNGMLLSVRPDNSPHYMLAHICWTMATDGELQMGISMLAGAPLPVGLTRSPDGSGDAAGLGLLMPAVERIGQPECVAMPSGWYRKSRDLLVSAGNAQRRVRMVESLERGSDFDLARIEPVA